MKAPYVLLVTGSRRLDCYNVFHKMMGITLARWGAPSLIIAGGATGIDTLAKRYADEMQYAFTEFPANWKLYGKRAGPIRNTEMVHLADKVVAFVDDQSVGTWDTIRKAKACSGMDVLVYKVSLISK